MTLGQRNRRGKNGKRVSTREATEFKGVQTGIDLSGEALETMIFIYPMVGKSAADLFPPFAIVKTLGALSEMINLIQAESWQQGLTSGAKIVGSSFLDFITFFKDTLGNKIYEFTPVACLNFIVSGLNMIANKMKGIPLSTFDKVKLGLLFLKLGPLILSLYWGGAGNAIDRGANNQELDKTQQAFCSWAASQMLGIITLILSRFAYNPVLALKDRIGAWWRGKPSDLEQKLLNPEENKDSKSTALPTGNSVNLAEHVATNTML